MVNQFTRNNLIALFFCSTAFASQPQELLLQGNKHAQAGLLQDALDAYQKIDNKGSAVWYNMGRVAQGLDLQTDAYIYFLRARAVAPFGQYRVMSDAVTAQQKTLGVYKEPTYRQAAIAFVTHISRLLSLLWWQILALIFWFRFIFFMYRRSYRMSMMMFVLIMVLIAMLATSYYDHRHYAVVISESAAVRSGMNDQFSEIGQLGRHDILVVQDQHDEWIQVWHNGVVGWVHKETVTLL